MSCCYLHDSIVGLEITSVDANSSHGTLREGELAHLFLFALFSEAGEKIKSDKQVVIDQSCFILLTIHPR